MNGQTLLIQEEIMAGYGARPLRAFRAAVACLLLTRTRGSVVRTVLDEVFRVGGDPVAMSVVPDVVGMRDELRYLLRPLGLQNKRADGLVRFAEDWLEHDGDKDVACGSAIDIAMGKKRPFGVGDYVRDAWDLTVARRLPADPADKELSRALGECYRFWDEQGDHERLPDFNDRALRWTLERRAKLLS